jgi:hypothetical protein
LSRDRFACLDSLQHAFCAASAPDWTAELIREACLGLDEAEARETVELLKQLGPRDVRKALTIRRLVILDGLMVETVGLARASSHPMLRDAYVEQACALSRAATNLAQARADADAAKTAQAIRAFESLAERLEAIAEVQKAKTLRRWWRRIIRQG